MEILMKLKAKLILLNTGILFFVGMMMFLQFRSAQTKQKYEIRKSFAQNSDKLQKNISNVFYLYYHNAQNIALNGSLKTKNFDDVNFYFNELVSLYPMYDMILYVDKDGKYISSNSLDNVGKNLKIDEIKGMSFSDQEWFKAFKEGKLVEDYEKKIYGSFVGQMKSSPVVSKLYGQDRVGNYFGTQVNDEFGDLQGYVVTFVNIKWATNEIMSLNSSLEKEGKKGSQIFLAKNDGTVVSEVKDSALVDTNLFKMNIKDTFKGEIEAVQNLVEPTFFESMFVSDDSKLVAFSQFSNEKFVDSLGWSVFVEMGSEFAFKSISVASNIFTISFVITLIFASFLASVVSARLSNNLLSIASQIAEGSTTISGAADKLSEHSQGLSSATSEQASSLQQTVASLNEISAMVNKNTDASKGSKSLSAQSRGAAETGKNTIDRMIRSIDDISDSNSQIIGQMKQNTDEMQAIISVIREIEDKTKVINDIVFQTKLLSFNASVEAARAGEHGKGFSVVAEEVGNLAQHSGDAAKQIEDMLVQSVNRVESIAKQTEIKVEELIRLGTSKVEEGKNIARECDKALGEILDNANTLDDTIEEIAIASVEQSQGIQEITKAMSELDKVTKQNSIIAHETSLNTQSLNKQALNLTDISVLLTDLITGKKNSSTDLATINVKANKPKSEKEQKKIETKKKANVINFSKASEKKKEAQAKVAPVSEKKVASSDISVPNSDIGEWEDI